MEEALESRLVPETVFVLDRSDGSRAADRGAAVLTVTERVMAKLATTRHPRGPVAVVPMPAMPTRPTGSALVLWGVGDPGNLGTSIRSSVAFGVAVIVGPGCADLWNPKVLRAAAGAHFRGTVVAAPDLTVDRLRAWGLATIAAVPTGGRSVESVLGGDVAFLVGAEGPGLGGEVIDAADASVTIPMPGGSQSLNAGVTASLLAYELARSNVDEPD